MTAVTCAKLCGSLQPIMHEFDGKLPTRELQERKVAEWEMQSCLSCSSVTMFSILPTTKGQVEEWPVNNTRNLERTCKVHSRSISVDKFRKTMKILRQDNMSLVQYFNPRPPEQNDGKLLTRPHCSGRIRAKMVETHPPRPNKSSAFACCKTGSIRSCCKTGYIRSLISNPQVFVFFVQICILAVGVNSIVYSKRTGNYLVYFGASMRPNVHH
jgi:hypothetical protein